MLIAPWLGVDILWLLTLVFAGFLSLGQPRSRRMLGSVATEVDLIEELRLRRWARENYVPRNRRECSWHAVVLDEMERKDREARPSETVTTICA